MIAITRTLSTTGIPVWQGIGKDIQLVQGGFALTVPAGVPLGAIIPAGTPVIYDEATRQASFAASSTLYAATVGGALAYWVPKNSPFKVGDYLAAAGTGGAAYAITAIDTTNAGYDILTVGTTLGALAAGSGVYASTATGGAASAYIAANGLLYDDTAVAAGETISVVIRGTIYARRMASYSAGVAALVGLKNIIFSQSK